MSESLVVGAREKLREFCDCPRDHLEHKNISLIKNLTVGLAFNVIKGGRKANVRCLWGGDGGEGSFRIEVHGRNSENVKDRITTFIVTAIDEFNIFQKIRVPGLASTDLYCDTWYSGADGQMVSSQIVEGSLFFRNQVSDMDVVKHYKEPIEVDGLLTCRTYKPDLHNLRNFRENRQMWEVDYFISTPATTITGHPYEGTFYFDVPNYLRMPGQVIDEINRTISSYLKNNR